MEPWAHEYADSHGHDEETQQYADVTQVMQPVEAANGLAHRIDAVGERKQWVDRLEERGRHFDGVQASRGRYLHEDEDDADALAQMLQGHRKRVDDAEIGQRSDD